MMKLSINKSKAFLPLSMSKGTTEQRLQKARLLNLRFYDNLLDKFDNREVKPSVFKRVLKETSGTKPGVEIFDSKDSRKAFLTPILGSVRKIRGYALYLPLTIWDGNIRQSSTRLFLKETQRFFNEMCKPKFLTRNIAMFNKHYNVREAQEFYSKNIEGKQVLTAEKLDEFLKDKKADEKINTLQFLRYTLQGDKNVSQAQYGIDKHIEKAEHLQFPNKSYDLSEYQYDEKLNLLNQRLKEVIQIQRKK